MSKQCQDEYTQQWRFDPLDAKLYDLAMEYHTRCEAYDRTVCEFRNDRGIAIPGDHKQLAAINRNSRSVIDSILERERGIERTRLMRAISKYSDRFEAAP